MEHVRDCIFIRAMNEESAYGRSVVSARRSNGVRSIDPPCRKRVERSTNENDAAASASRKIYTRIGYRTHYNDDYVCRIANSSVSREIE